MSGIDESSGDGSAGLIDGGKTRRSEGPWVPRESVEEEEEAEEEEAELGDAKEELPVIQDTRIPIQVVCANEREMGVRTVVTKPCKSINSVLERNSGIQRVEGETDERGGGWSVGCKFEDPSKGDCIRRFQRADREFREKKRRLTQDQPLHTRTHVEQPTLDYAGTLFMYHQGQQWRKRRAMISMWDPRESGDR